MGFIIGLLIGSIATGIIEYFVIKNNKQLIQKWIDEKIKG